MNNISSESLIITYCSKHIVFNPHKKTTNLSTILSIIILNEKTGWERVLVTYPKPQSFGYKGIKKPQFKARELGNQNSGGPSMLLPRMSRIFIVSLVTVFSFCKFFFKFSWFINSLIASLTLVSACTHTHSYAHTHQLLLTTNNTAPDFIEKVIAIRQKFPPENLVHFGQV